MFEKHARGDMGFEYGIPAEGARKILMNPIYNGWAVRSSRRHGRGRPEEHVPDGGRRDPRPPRQRRVRAAGGGGTRFWVTLPA